MNEYTPEKEAAQVAAEETEREVSPPTPPAPAVPANYKPLFKLMGALAAGLVFYVALYVAINLFMFVGVRTRAEAMTFCVAFTAVYTFSLFFIALLNEFSTPSRFIFLAVGLGLVIAVYLCLINYESASFTAGIRPMIEDMQATGFGALAHGHTAATMPVQYVLACAALLPMDALYVAKLIGLIAAIILGAGVSRLVSLFAQSEALIAGVGALAAIIPLLGVGALGVFTVVYASFCVMGLYFGVTGRPISAAVFFGLAAISGAGGLIMLPVIAVLMMAKQFKGWHWAILVAVILVGLVPGVLLSGDLGAVFSTIGAGIWQVDELSAGAPTLFALFDGPGYMFANAGYMLFALAAAALLYFFYANRMYIDQRTAVAGALLITLTLTFVLPKLTPTDFLLPCALSAVYPVLFYRRLHVPLMVMGAALICASAEFGAGMPVPLCAVVIAAAIAVVAYDVSVEFREIRLMEAEGEVEQG